MDFLGWVEQCGVKLVSIGALGLVFVLMAIGIKHLVRKHFHGG